MTRLLAVAAAFAAIGAVSVPAGAAEPVQVMVLGTYHFGNPGLDLNNIKADDVLKPQRQKELQALAAALATYRPTKIMIERIVQSDDLLDPKYASFRPADLRTTRDERIQVGYRLANRLGHKSVYGIDEQPTKGEPDYFPFGAVMAWAKTNGRGAELEATMGKASRIVTDMEARQKTQTIPELLQHDNTAQAEASAQSFYYDLLSYGDTNAQPGADLNAMWYLRNAKIFAKLMKAAGPGDRVLVVYGGGHNYWLRHFARTTPGYSNVDPVPYLSQAAEALK
jgi:hypothetical protein